MVVLHVLPRLLLVPLHLTVLRREEERFCRDVHPSHHHHCLARLLLDLQPLQVGFLCSVKDNTFAETFMVEKKIAVAFKNIAL